MTTASDAWMSIFERCFLNPVFLNAANVGIRRAALNDESADVPENIAVVWSLRVPRYATAAGTLRKPISVRRILLCIAVCRPYTCVPGCTCFNMCIP